jgi:hypothetical protein
MRNHRSWQSCQGSFPSFPNRPIRSQLQLTREIWFSQSASSSAATRSSKLKTVSGLQRSRWHSDGIGPTPVQNGRSRLSRLSWAKGSFTPDYVHRPGLMLAAAASLLNILVVILDVGAEAPLCRSCAGDDIPSQTHRRLIYGTDQDSRAAKADVLEEVQRQCTDEVGMEEYPAPSTIRTTRVSFGRMCISSSMLTLLRASDFH